MNERPSVLFVCVSNRGKSVMAEALMRHRHGNQVNASSAGTQAAIGGAVNHLSAEALSEVGASVTDHVPVQLTSELLSTVGLVVVVGSARLETPAGIAVEVWAIDEPSERGIEGIERMRMIRDEITERVDDLAARLDRD